MTTRVGSGSVGVSGDGTSLADPHAFDPKSTTEGIEVTIVMQHAGAASGGCGGNQVVGSGHTAVASQFA